MPAKLPQSGNDCSRTLGQRQAPFWGSHGLLQLLRNAMHKAERNHNVHARRLFDGIAGRYDIPAQVLSLFQYGRWRSFLTSRLAPSPGDVVMDLCTGTGGVGIQLARIYRSRVVGIDLSEEMVRRARRAALSSELDGVMAFTLGRAESLSFSDASFDDACFTFLLRYVKDPPQVLAEIARVLKPGGCLASLEFGLPENRLVRGLWYLYTRGLLPLATAPISGSWRRVGSFLGPSISRFYREYTIDDLRKFWINAGIVDVDVKRLSLGGAVVIWGTKSPE